MFISCDDWMVFRKYHGGERCSGFNKLKRWRVLCYLQTGSDVRKRMKIKLSFIRSIFWRMRSIRVSRWDLSEWLERLTAIAVIPTILSSIPTSSDTVESEGWQVKHWWISYIKRKNPSKIPLCKKFWRMSAICVTGKSWDSEEIQKQKFQFSFHSSAQI